MHLLLSLSLDSFVVRSMKRSRSNVSNFEVSLLMEYPQVILAVNLRGHKLLNDTINLSYMRNW